MSDVMNGPAEPQTGTALAVIETPSTALAVIKTGVSTVIAADKNDILGKLAADLAAFKADVTTEKGRKEIASKAYKVATAKQNLIRLAGTLKEDAQKTIKATNAEVKVIEEKMDELRDQVRKPLDDFERIEKDRVAAHETALADIIAMGTVDGLTSDEIKANLWEVPSIEARAWQEFADKADRTIGEVLQKLTAAHAAAVEREAAEIEAERLRQVEAERMAAENEQKRIEREEQIARDAAALATMQAEAKAEEARQAAALALAEAQLTAKRLADEAEANRIKGHKDALAAMDAATHVAPGSSSATIKATLEAFSKRPARNWEEFAEEAVKDAENGLAHLIACLETAEERERVEAEKQRIAAEEKAKADAAAAVAAEQARVAQAAAAQKAMDDARAKNVAHQKQVNNEALADMMGAVPDLAEDQARAIIKAIAKGLIHGVHISY